MNRENAPVIRMAGERDVGGVVALVQSAYRGEASRAGWTTEADLLEGQRTDPEMIRELLAAPGKRLLLAEDGGDVVGTVLVEDEGDAGYIGLLAVEPSLQGAGLGRRLLAEAERVVRDELGRPSARMCVIAQRDELIAWYERQGYVRTGETEAFPYDDARFGEPKRPDLYFALLSKSLAG